jgi:DNA-binding HxlR family transcriptional regulator
MQSVPSFRLPCGGESCAEQAAWAIELLRNRWSVAILEQLGFVTEPLRFGELQRRVGGISQRELSRQLQLLVSRDVLVRTVRAQKPLQVDYALTSSGWSLLAHVEALSAWAEGKSGVKKRAHRVVESGGLDVSAAIRHSKAKAF